MDNWLFRQTKPKQTQLKPKQSQFKPNLPKGQNERKYLFHKQIQNFVPLTVQKNKPKQTQFQMGRLLVNRMKLKLLNFLPDFGDFVLSTSLDNLLQIHPNLAQLVKAWPELPEHIEAAIKASVQTHSKGAK